MEDKCKISFDVETSLEDKDEIQALIWTLLNIGKNAYGEIPMDIPDLKNISVEPGVEIGVENPFKLYISYPPRDPLFYFDGVPADPEREEARLSDLSDAINYYKSERSNIKITYSPNGNKEDAVLLYVFDGERRVGEWNEFFLDDHPELK